VERLRLSVRALARSFKIICVHVRQIAVVVVGSNYCLHDETQPHTAPTVIHRATQCTDCHKLSHTLHRPLQTEPHTGPTVTNRTTHCTDRYKQNHKLHRPLQTKPHTAPTVMHRATHCTGRYKHSHTMPDGKRKVSLTL